MTASGLSSRIRRETAGASRTSISELVGATISWFTNPAARTTSLPSIPPPPVTRIFTPTWISAAAGSLLQNRDLGVVAHHKAVGFRQRRAARDCDVPADQAGFHAALEVVQGRARQDDGVLDLRVGDAGVLPDRRVGPDVGVRDLRAGAHDRRAPHRRPLEPRPRLHD